MSSAVIENGLPGPGVGRRDQDMPGPYRVRVWFLVDHFCDRIIASIEVGAEKLTFGQGENGILEGYLYPGFTEIRILIFAAYAGQKNFRLIGRGKILFEVDQLLAYFGA